MKNGLHQDQVWTTADGRTLRLEDMDVAHRANALRYLRARAEQLKLNEVLTLLGGPQPRGDAACDMFDSMCEQIERTPADEWIEQQPLVIRLAELVEQDRQHKPWHGIAVAAHNLGYRLKARWLV